MTERAGSTSRAIFSDSAGKLLDRNFEPVGPEDDGQTKPISLPLSGDAKTGTHYRLSLRVKLVSVAGKIILPQPVSLFFRRPLDRDVVNIVARGRDQLSETLVFQIEKLVTNGLPFDARTEITAGARPVRASKWIDTVAPWPAWEIASFPNINMYDTFEQFESACEKWLANASDATEAFIDRYNLGVVKDGSGKKRGAIDENDHDLEAMAAELREGQHWFMHPHEYSHVIGELEVQGPKSVVELPGVGAKDSDAVRTFVESKVPFAGECGGLGELCAAYKAAAGNGFAVNLDVSDGNVTEYEQFGCIGAVRPRRPEVRELGIPKWALYQIVHLPYVCLAYERTAYSCLVRMLVEKDFAFAGSVESMYRVVNVFRTFIPYTANVIDPRCDLLETVKDAPAFCEAYQLFFKCYLWDILCAMVTSAGIGDCLIPVETATGKQRTLLVTYLNEKGLQTTMEIQGRKLDQTFASMLGSLMCVSTLFDDEIILQFVLVSFRPFLAKFDQISRACEPAFNRTLWSIVGDLRIMRALLLDLSVQTSAKPILLTGQMVEYGRVLLSINAQLLPKEMWIGSTNWAIYVLSLLVQANFTLKTKKVLRVMKLLLDLMFRRWKYRRNSSPAWAASIGQVQSPILQMLRDEENNPMNALLLVQMLTRTLFCKESLEIFRRESTALATLGHMFVSPHKTIRGSAWKTLDNIFRYVTLEALELTLAPPFRNLLFSLFQNESVREHALYFITCAISYMELAGKPMKYKKRRAVDVFLDFVEAGHYQFNWYFDHGELAKESSASMKLVKKIAKMMTNKFVAKAVKSRLPPEARAMMQSEEKKMKEKRRRK